MQKFLLIIVLAILLASPIRAQQTPDTRPKPPPSQEEQKFDFWWSQMPTVCGDRQEVVKWLDKHEFAPVSMSFGRENGRPEGAPVYVITIFVNDNYSMAATVETPTSDEVCILFRTYDMKLNPNLRPQGLTL